MPIVVNQRSVTGSLPMNSSWLGVEIGERRIWQLCSQKRFLSTSVTRGRKGKSPVPAVNDDFLRPDITAKKQNRK